MLKSIDERMDELIRAITEEAQGEAEKLRSEASQREAEIIDAGKQEAEKIRDQILSEVKKESEALKDKKIAQAQNQEKITWLAQREQLITEVLTQVRSRFPELPNRHNYPDILMELMHDAILRLQSQQVILHFDPISRTKIDEHKLQNLALELGVEIVIGEDLKNGLGVVASDPEGHRTLENTFEVRMESQMDVLRAGIYHILMGEEL